MISRESARKQWIAALRSGKYRQGKHVLHSVSPEDSRYCCLGVACDLFAEELGLNREMFSGNEIFSGMISILPDSVVSLLDLVSNTGNSLKGEEALVCKNDGDSSFEEIANLLESGKYWKD